MDQAINVFEQYDHIRCFQGQWLGAAGLAPIETPSQIMFSAPPVTLKSYGDPGPAAPVLLIVPAPIKRGYIWDLIPRSSVVRQCLNRGVRVFLIQWEQPDRGQSLGLAEYADQFILDCLDAVSAETGRRAVFLAGHSLGGTFAAIFAALHPDRVRGLILLGAPLQFGRDAGALAPLVALAPRTPRIFPLRGNVPGTFLNLVSVLAAPDSFVGERWVDWQNSLSDVQALHTHLRVVRWTLDEMPLPVKLFEEIIELLYRKNRFMEGTLMIRGRRAAAKSVEAPVISVVDQKSRVSPPASILPFHQAAFGNKDTQLLWYAGDTGVVLQHVGMLVGKRAHQEIWPEILQWVHAQGHSIH